MDSKLVNSSLSIVHRKSKTVNREHKTLNWRFMRRGLTLVELIAGLGIIGFVIVMFASVYIAHTRLFSSQNTQIEVASQNRLAVDEMVNQIRESEAVVASCLGCSPDATGANTLIIQLWPLDINGDPTEPTTGNDYIIYKRGGSDNTKLIKKIVPDTSSSRQSSEKIIASYISELTFTYEPDNNDPPTATSVTVSVTTEGQSGAKTLTSTQSVKAVLRNK